MEWNSHRSLGLVLYLGTIIVPARVSANLMTFTSQADFLVAARETTLESFESLPDRPLSNNPILVGPFTLTPIGGIADVRSSPTDGHLPTDGVKYVSFGHSLLASSTIEFSMLFSATSFGLSVTDFGDINPGTLTIRTDLGEAGSGILIASNPPPRENGNLLFFGFVQDTLFTRVSLTITTPLDGIGIDGVYFNSIPEASSLLMVCVGATAVLASAGRKIRGRARGIRGEKVSWGKGVSMGKRCQVAFLVSGTGKGPGPEKVSG